MTKKMNNRNGQKHTTGPDHWPVVVSVAAFAFGTIGYVIVGEIILSAQPHPLHWISGLVSGALGVGLGWVWYRWKGDII